MLTIDHLEKRFGSTVLFRDLTFTVDGPAVLWAPAAGGPENGRLRKGQIQILKERFFSKVFC